MAEPHETRSRRQSLGGRNRRRASARRAAIAGLALRARRLARAPAVAMGDGRSRAGAAGALAAGRFRLRHRRLFHRRPRTGLVGGAGCGACRHGRRIPGAPARARLCHGARLCRHRRRLCHRHIATARIAHPVLAFPVTASVTALSRCARNARAATASWCACSRSRRAGSIPAPQRVRVAVRKGTAPAVGSFVSFKAHLAPPLAPLQPGGYDFARDMYFQRIGASGYVLGKIKPLAGAAAGRLVAALCRGARRHAREHQQAHPRAAAGRPRLDRLGADHGKAQRDFRAGERRLLRVEPRACAGDLRLSHGGGGGHRVLFHPRRLGAGAVARQPLPDQEMGGRGRARDRRFLSRAVGLEHFNATRLHHDRHRARRRHARPPGLDVPHHRGRGFRRAAAHAGGDRASELPDVVCRGAGADRGLSIRPASGDLARQADTLGRRARWRCGAGAKSPAWCWPRWSPDLPPRLIRPSTFIVWRPMACWPICWPCRSSRSG